MQLRCAATRSASALPRTASRPAIARSSITSIATPRAPLSAAHTSSIIHRRSRMAYTTIAAAGGSLAGSPSSERLLICGPGVLGSYLATLWLDDFGAGTVVGQTNTTNNHAALSALGVSPRTKADADATTFPFVVYSAPPSGSEDYVGDVKASLERWDRSGAFVFTSSAAVYAVEDGSACDESAQTVAPGANPRTDTLLAAEQAVLDAGGCVVRLVGLYHKTRGAHTFFLKQGEVPRWGGYIVNLIHYEDAAGLTAAVLRGDGSSGAGWHGRVFLGCDGAPVTFTEMMEGIEASGVLPGSVTFTGPESAVKGKRMSNTATREALGWSPRYSSIGAFFAAGGDDWYAQQGAKAPAGASHA